MTSTRLFTALICMEFLLPIKAQTPATGNNPSSIHWKYYDTKAVKVIFPEGSDKEATRVANIINFIYDSAGVTVGPKRKHLDLLLQTNQVVSNGYVGLAPYRSEFYATAPQNFNILGSTDWIDLLSFHEYRHALQLANERHGFVKFLSIFGGQNLWQLGQAISIPNWYLEGDAVQTETLFSGAGRGRNPYFFRDQRALLFGNRHYSYMKARNGSFRNMVPDHYRLGYAMLHQVRAEKGPDVWAKILRDASAYKGVFYPFSKAMRRHTGYSSRKSYYRIYDSLETQWKRDLAAVQLIPATTVTPLSNRTVTDYQWAHILDDGSILCHKVSYKKTAEIILIKDGKEKKLVTVGFTAVEPFLSHNNGRLAWTEFTSDKRWQNRNYSEVRTYDMKTGVKKRLARHTKLFSPQFSAKGDRIVAVNADEHLKNKIVFLDPATGAETGSIPNPENDFISFPQWTKDDKAIVFQARRQSKLAILKYDLESQALTELTPWSQHVLGPMSLGSEQVYYSASYTGINNIFAVSLSGDKVIRQLSSVMIAAEMPVVSADEKTLYFSEFDYKGTQISRQAIDLASAKTIDVVEPADQEIYRIKTTPVENKLFDKLPSQSLEARNYKGFIRGAKLHSWSVSGSQSEVSIGLAINNILNDFGAQVTGGYNLNEKSPFVRGRIDYARFYLPLSLLATMNQRSIDSPTNLADTGATSTNTTYFREAIYGGSVSLPLHWIKGIYNRSFVLSAGASQIVTSDYRFNDVDYINPNDDKLFVFEGSLHVSNLRGRARQNVNPRFGQDIQAYLGASNTGSSIKYMAQGSFFFPGFSRNHSFFLKGGYIREELSNDYRFADNFIHARGYQPLRGDQEYLISGNYQLPIAYPDWGFGGLLYFQRFRLNLFVDYSQVTRNTMSKTYDQTSYGFELLFDTKVVNLMPLAWGIRNSVLANRNYYNADMKSRVELFFAGTF